MKKKKRIKRKIEKMTNSEQKRDRVKNHIEGENLERRKVC